MSKKRILLITNHFFPETFRCNDLAFGLAKQGHQVSVLTGIPDYPSGRFHSGYGLFRRRIELIKGVKVYRSFIIPRGHGGSWRLILNYTSSLLAQCWDACLMGLFGRYDYVLVHETSPVMVGIPGVIVARMKRIPMDFWVLDLWPESLQSAGGINNTKILAFFGKLTTWIYKHADHILISSRGFRKSICDKGAFEEKLVYFPNWADVELTGMSPSLLPSMPDGFRVMFAGNIGEAQDMEHLMATALELRDEKGIHFCIVGDGRKRLWLEEFVKSNHLEGTVHLMGQYPVEMMPAFFSAANVMLVTLKDSTVFNLTAPAKLQAYMNAGKPIAAMMNGEGAAVIAEAACGISVAAGDVKSFAELIKQMSQMSKEDLEYMGSRGKRYCSTHFSFSRSIETIEQLM